MKKEGNRGFGSEQKKLHSSSFFFLLSTFSIPQAKLFFNFFPTCCCSPFFHHFFLQTLCDCERKLCCGCGCGCGRFRSWLFSFDTSGFLYLIFGFLQWELVAPDLVSVFGLLRSNPISTTCRVPVSVTLWFSFVDGGLFFFVVVGIRAFLFVL